MASETRVVLDANRDPRTGRRAPAGARWGVTTIWLERAGRAAYQLGDRGAIYADRAVAARHALDYVESSPAPAGRRDVFGIEVRGGFGAGIAAPKSREPEARVARCVLLLARREQAARREIARGPKAEILRAAEGHRARLERARERIGRPGRRRRAAAARIGATA